MPPTRFQSSILWAAITAFSCVVIAGVIVFVGWLLVNAISYLQPVLMPVAIAAILAYLLDPAVRWLQARRFPRTLAVITVFLAFLGAGVGIGFGVVPALWHQGAVFAHSLPEYVNRTQGLVNKTVDEAKRLSELPIFKKPADPNEPVDPLANYVSSTVKNGADWLQREAPTMAVSTGRFIQRSLGGFLGVFGFLISLILVPLFLFFFLKDGQAISENWSRYLPLRASPLKREIVSLFTEINDYLINFFRGQLIVSMINGFLVAMGLFFFVGLEFALVIGLMVAVLGLIPYAGILISWIPAVLIAVAQFGDWWHPLLVTIIFVGMNWFEGFLISPKIIGESVGLHPLTVIISVLAWSLVLGGLLGALLAVPLTATIKVVLKRYFWDRPIEYPRRPRRSPATPDTT